MIGDEKKSVFFEIFFSVLTMKNEKILGFFMKNEEFDGQNPSNRMENMGLTSFKNGPKSHKIQPKQAPKGKKHQKNQKKNKTHCVHSES